MSGVVGIVCLLLASGYAIDNRESENEYSKQNITRRIVGGYEVKIEEFPWQASIIFNGRHNCGGSIIGKSYILTAAHCTYGLSIHKMRVRVGSSYSDRGGLVYGIAAVRHHPEFIRERFQNDISILKLKSKLVYTDQVQPILLPLLNDPEPKHGMYATVTGFGQVNADDKKMSPRLRAVDVRIISREKCENRYRRYLVDETMVCTANPKGAKDSCSGDSGGPLTMNDIQIGVVSWGISCASSKNPSVYASVKNALNFIKRVTRHNK